MICYWYDAPTYLFFASDLPGLLYYSHIPTVIITLLVGFFVLWSNPKNLTNRLLFALALCFSIWIYINLVAWTHINSEYLLFTWSFFGILQALMSIISIYLVYSFIYKNDVPIYYKFIFLSLLAPVFLFSSTDLSLSGFDLAWCDAFRYEGMVYKIYYTLLGIVAILWNSILVIKEYKKSSSEIKQQMIIFVAGINLFLFLFFNALFFATYLAGLGILDDSRLEFYGLFGMTFFMVIIGFLIVRFKSFNVGIHASQALVIALLILVGSQFTYVDTATTTTLTAITFVLTAIAGFIIVRSVKKEIAQRKEIENLAKSLERANKRLKVLDKMKSEFVSIASHQLRSPLTSIRGYASMLLEGSFGNLSAKAQEAVERIAESSKYMATSVEDYLNVSRIQAGNMKYEYSDFNLRDKVEAITDDLRQQAIKKGLLLTFKSDMEYKGVVNADIGKTQQIIHNLINNSLKYTPKGAVKVIVKDQKRPKRIMVDIVDTGIGMSPETIENMFEKFERDEKANSVNVSGTGLGLYIARKMARDMGGDVYAISEGEGKGSTFTLELPLKM